MLDTTASMTQYIGGGGESVFPIPFPFLETSHIHAHIRDSAGLTRSLTAGVDCTVVRIPGANGELVLLAENLPAGHVLTIRRLLPLTQEILFHNQGPNSPRAMEEAADKLTMIAQQLRADLDNCLAAPDPEAAAALSEAATESAARVAAMESSLAAKAEKNHSHASGEVAGLAAALAAKADAGTLERMLAGKADLTLLAGKADATALSAKADKTELALKADASALAAKADLMLVAAKADAVHSHAPADIAGLSAALDGKLDRDDPRLDAVAAAPHAAAHAAGGADALSPAALGVLPAPPADGKVYLAAAGGWTEYIPPEPSSGGGVSDHALLENRDAADQHPQSAIRDLPADLGGIRAALSELAAADGTLDGKLAAKADRTELPAAATDLRSGLLSAADKAKLDSLSPADLEERLSAFARRLETAETGVASGETSIGAISERLTAAETGLTSVRSGVESVSAGAEDLDIRVQAAAAAVARLAEEIASLGDLARAADAPGDGLQYVRTNKSWAVLQTPPPAETGGGGGAGGGIIGDIRLLPFRASDLPPGWHFCNGAALSLASAAGQALAALPESFRVDWGIVASALAITLPNLFDPETGAGLFPRSVDNAARLPGSAQGDAIRNITGSFSPSATLGSTMINPTNGLRSQFAGVFTTQASAIKANGPGAQSYGTRSTGDLLFDASRAVPTAEENRPVNIGMTPAIYLGA